MFALGIPSTFRGTPLLFRSFPPHSPNVRRRFSMVMHDLCAKAERSSAPRLSANSLLRWLKRSSVYRQKLSGATEVASITQLVEWTLLPTGPNALLITAWLCMPMFWVGAATWRTKIDALDAAPLPALVRESPFPANRS